MKLDRSKKYEGLGLTWAWSDILLYWHGSKDGHGQADAFESTFQAWLDAGHIKPVKETKIVRWENVTFKFNAVRFTDFHTLEVMGASGDIGAILEGAISLPVTLEFPVEVEA